VRFHGKKVAELEFALQMGAVLTENVACGFAFPSHALGKILRQAHPVACPGLRDLWR